MIYYTAGAIISCILYFSIGLIASRRIKNSSDYYVSGRNASTLLMVSSLIASYLSTVVFMGDAGFSYDGYAIPLLIMSIFVIPGFVIGVLFFGRYLRRSESLTIPHYFGARFNSRRVRVAASLTLIVGITTYLVAVTQGIGLLFSEITGLNYIVSLTIVVFIYTSITFLSGAKGIILIDTIMFLIFSAATFIALPYIINAAGGFPDAIIAAKNLIDKPNLLSWHGVTGESNYMGNPFEVILYTAIIGIVWGVVLAVSPWQATRHLMAKSEHVAIRSAVISTVVIIVMYLIIHLSMTLVNVLNPNINPSERVFIWAVMNHVPTSIGVIAISGIFAATLATGSAFLQLIANTIAKDLIDERKISDDKQLLKISRVTVIIVAAISLLITIYQPPAMFWIAIFAATIFAASWGPVAFASVLSKKMTEPAAFWSIVNGFFGVIITEFLILFKLINLPLYLNSAVFGAILSIATLIIVMKNSESTTEELAYYDKLMIVPEMEEDKREIQKTKRSPYILIVTGFLVIAVTYYLYYLPQ